MGYVESVLQPGETVVYRTRLSWTMYIPGLLVLFAAAVLFGIERAVFGPTLWGDILALIVAAVGVVLLIGEWFERWTTEIAITDRRLIYKRGFIRRDTIEMSVEKVESIDVNQSLLGRLFDYGDITVRGIGSGFAPLRDIDSPLEFRSHVTGLPGAKPVTAAQEES